ncbi:MAG: hypothetical protein ACMG6S_24110 [Byssovorax sp.]
MAGAVKARLDSLAIPAASAGLAIALRLPVEGWPRAWFHSDFGFGDARLEVGGAIVLQARTRACLERGVTGTLPGGEPCAMRLATEGGALRIEVEAAGLRALREDRVWARPTRSAWIHASIALAGSAAGFAASWFYLVRARAMDSAWAMKMGYHTAGWHLLLTLTLFPASVWGQRAGIRAVQLVSLVFFFIHAGMALANSGQGDPAIAVFNALSGLAFLLSFIYGQRAHRDMDPIVALRTGRI